jgi:hypothetical protein
VMGEVVSVNMDEPIIRKTNLVAIKEAVIKPSLYILIFQKRNTSVSPGVKNTLNTTVKIIMTNIIFKPFSINLIGTFESPIIVARNTNTKP